ncbi:MAG: SAM-dependent methyltransferase, partial [candidate division KSB1 bacterium]|nr:SAM-dependent methyltransferase [candidate division KSB1 bacterium]
MTFKDHFSTQAVDYAKYRPHYPAAMFEYLATLPPERQTAWDCATGNGQAALGLTPHFERVIATDASAR